MSMGRWLRYRTTGAAFVFAALALVAPRFAAAQSKADTEWHHFGHDAANTKYSPLDQITPENFGDLEIAWRWRSIETAVTREREEIRPGPFKSVSLMIDGLVYLSTSLGQVAALDAGTGELVWSYDPQTYDRLDRPANMGWQHRGVSYWEDDQSDDARIFMPRTTCCWWPSTPAPAGSMPPSARTAPSTSARLWAAQSTALASPTRSRSRSPATRSSSAASSRTQA